MPRYRITWFIHASGTTTAWSSVEHPNDDAAIRYFREEFARTTGSIWTSRWFAHGGELRPDELAFAEAYDRDGRLIFSAALRPAAAATNRWSRLPDLLAAGYATRASPPEPAYPEEW